MFIYRTSVHLRDTDATGVLYFTEQLRYALEALEHFLMAQGLTLQALIQDGAFLMPIVHAESDYSAPLFAGDEIEVHLSLTNLGTTSFTLQTRLYKGGAEVGRTAIVHVTVSGETKKPIPVPESLLKILTSLDKNSCVAQPASVEHS